VEVDEATADGRQVRTSPLDWALDGRVDRRADGRGGGGGSGPTGGPSPSQVKVLSSSQEVRHTLPGCSSLASQPCRCASTPTPSPPPWLHSPPAGACGARVDWRGVARRGGGEAAKPRGVTRETAREAVGAAALAARLAARLSPLSHASRWPLQGTGILQRHTQRQRQRQRPADGLTVAPRDRATQAHVRTCSSHEDARRGAGKCEGPACPLAARGKWG